jgi:hypothetical protein
MSDGMEITEAPEAPQQESKEVEENPEKQAEIKEASEVETAINEATSEPLAAIEKMEYAPAENLMGALVEAVDAVPVKETPEMDDGKTEDPGESGKSPVESSDQTQDKSPGAPSSGAEASESSAGISRDGLEADGVSETAPTITLEGSREEGRVTIERPAAETASEPDLETVHRDGDEPEMVIKDSNADDKFNMDDGLEQANDLKEPNQVSGQYGSAGDPTKGSVGYVGDPAQGAGVIPEIPDMIPDLEIGGAGEPDREIPDLGLPGLDEESEVQGLAGSVAHGADPRISGDADTDDTAEDTSDDTSGDTSDTTSSGKTADQGHQTNSDGTVGTEVSAPTTVRSLVGDIWGAVTSDSNDDSPETAVYGRRGTPTPDGIEKGDFDDTLGGLVSGVIPDATPDDLDDESVMQPVGEEDSASRKDPNLVFDRSSQTDPYSQYTGEETNIPGVISTGEVDADGNLIDGPDTVLGEEGGFISTDSSKKNAADTEDAANLNAADLSSDGQVPKP